MQSKSMDFSAKQSKLQLFFIKCVFKWERKTGECNGLICGKFQLFYIQYAQHNEEWYKTVATRDSSHSVDEIDKLLS